MVNLKKIAYVVFILYIFRCSINAEFEKYVYKSYLAPVSLEKNNSFSDLSSDFIDNIDEETIDELPTKFKILSKCNHYSREDQEIFLSFLFESTLSIIVNNQEKCDTFLKNIISIYTENEWIDSKIFSTAISKYIEYFEESIKNKVIEKFLKTVYDDENKLKRIQRLGINLLRIVRDNSFKPRKNLTDEDEISKLKVVSGLAFRIPYTNRGLYHAVRKLAVRLDIKEYGLESNEAPNLFIVNNALSSFFKKSTIFKIDNKEITNLITFAENLTERVDQEYLEKISRFLINIGHLQVSFLSVYNKMLKTGEIENIKVEFAGEGTYKEVYKVSVKLLEDEEIYEFALKMYKRTTSQKNPLHEIKALVMGNTNVTSFKYTPIDTSYTKCTPYVGELATLDSSKFRNFNVYTEEFIDGPEFAFINKTNQLAGGLLLDTIKGKNANIDAVKSLISESSGTLFQLFLNFNKLFFMTDPNLKNMLVDDYYKYRKLIKNSCFVIDVGYPELLYSNAGFYYYLKNMVLDQIIDSKSQQKDSIKDLDQSIIFKGMVNRNSDYAIEYLLDLYVEIKDYKSYINGKNFDKAYLFSDSSLIGKELNTLNKYKDFDDLLENIELFFLKDEIIVDMAKYCWIKCKNDQDKIYALLKSIYGENEIIIFKILTKIINIYKEYQHQAEILSNLVNDIKAAA